MDKNTFDKLMNEISKLKPHEWNQVVNHVNKKYSSKQLAVPMPSKEELGEYHLIDIPSLKD